METDGHKRIRTEATYKALSVGAPGIDLNNEEDAADVAETLDVPEALVWLACDQVAFDLIDELVAWWPRKEGA
jgi:hypothetical protein